MAKKAKGTPRVAGLAEAAADVSLDVREKPAAPPKQEPTQAQPEPESTSAPANVGLVRVRNTGRSTLRQPSSGAECRPGAVVPMNDDGWLDNQVRAGFLTKVE